MEQVAIDTRHDAAAHIAAARRVTIKVGSSLLIDPQTGAARREWLAGLAADIAGLRGESRRVAVVSSGAVALGRAHLGLKASARLDYKQAAAAAGQALLMQAWDAALGRHGIVAAQLLLTIDDSEQRLRWLNARATLEVLLEHGAVPVINENDSVATEELRYGDNDRLSARAAQMMRSDVLVLLSDVDGLHTADPALNPTADHIAYVPRIDDVAGYAAGSAKAGVGTGGMATKIAAARIACAFGCTTIIASGREDHPIARLRAGGRATVLAANGSPASAYKQWIAGSLEPAGEIAIDAGAVAALRAGRSLLPAGVTAVRGTFERGACVRVRDADGGEIARGLAAYPAVEARAIRGLGSDRFAERLGYRGPDELIHRDDLVLL